jgi:hypothetical protein
VEIERFLSVGDRLLRLACQCPEPGTGPQRVRARDTPAIVRREHAVDAADALGVKPSLEPEEPDFPTEGESAPRLAGRLEPVERGGEIVVLAVEAFEPAIGIAAQVRVGFLRECDEVLRVAAAHLIRNALRGELANRLEHPVALAGVA